MKRPTRHIPACTTLRSITRAEHLQEESRLKRDRESKWGGVILDQMYAALPGEE